MFVFAATGALIAARGRYDIITMLFFAAITGVGGGTLRDLLIGAPVFWVADSRYLSGFHRCWPPWRSGSAANISIASAR